MSRPAHRPLAYRPALDGLRAVAVLLVLVFHLHPAAAKGGWLGVDLFFVLSGFLITTLLVREYARRGKIDLRGFWSARARRLMPSLVTVLIAVLAVGAFWTPTARRPALAADVLSTTFYVQNWHLLLSDEAYFESNGTPSPLRHAWSLAIEEQYYLLFPLLLLLLARFIHRRRTLALAFFALAGCSAMWMAHLYVPDVDPTRVYYGTDTRAFELLIGAGVGAWVGPTQWGRRRAPRWHRAVTVAAWPCLALLVAWMFSVSQDVPAVFRGGLVIFCLAAIPCILAAASPHPNAFARVLAFEPLRRLGLISYALYLWHWPIITYLTAARLGTDPAVAALAQAALSLLLATLTYRYLEAPIRRGGLRAILPTRLSATRPVAMACVGVIALGAFALPHAPWPGSSLGSGAEGAELHYRAHTYVPGAKQRVVVVGNSIPHSLLTTLPAGTFSDLDVRESTSFGCTTFEGQQIADGKPVAPSAACRTFADNWSAGLAGARTMLYFVPHNLLDDYEVDGRRLQAGTPEHDSFIRTRLDGVLARSEAAKVTKPVLVNLACHRLPTFGDQKPPAINDTAKVRHLNSVVAAWARSKHVQVADQFDFLCPGGVYHGRINGLDLYQDALHFTDRSGPLVWSWLAPQIREEKKR